MKGKSYKAAMYGLWKSDNNIVPEKPANKKDKPFAEQVEGRALTEGNTLNTAAVRTQGRGAASISLQGVRRKAQQDKGARFNNLFHHITTELLTESFYGLKKNAAAGVDEMTWHLYKKGLAERIVDLELPVKIRQGSWEAYIPDAIFWVKTIAGIAETAYLAKAAQQMAENDFDNVAIKTVLAKSFEAIQWVIKIGEHLGTISIKKFEIVKFRNNNTEIGIEDCWL